MVGIPRRKEKATICPRGIRRSVPPIRVEPLLDIPGINANSWAQPIKNACLYEIVETSLLVSIGFKKRKIIPPTISAIAMIILLAKSVEIKE